LSNVTSSRTRVDVYPNGLAEAALNIGLTLGINARTISMTRAGQVRMN
jgi:hypothetical protein